VSPSADTRLCILQPSPEHTAGFALSGKSPAPYIICQIEKGSPAEKAGLQLNDALLSINDKSVTDATYEETVKLIKEGLQQKAIRLIVRNEQTNDNQGSLDRKGMGSGPVSSNERAKSSMGSTNSPSLGNSRISLEGSDSNSRGINPVEEYQSM
jgi:C-terminal processing protease CtpA/Prc